MQSIAGGRSANSRAPDAGRPEAVQGPTSNATRPDRKVATAAASRPRPPTSTPLSRLTSTAVSGHAATPASRANHAVRRRRATPCSEIGEAADPGSPGPCPRRQRPGQGDEPGLRRCRRFSPSRRLQGRCQVVASRVVSGPAGRGAAPPDRRALLLDEVTGHAPPAVRVPHRSHRFNGTRIRHARRCESRDHVLTMRSARQLAAERGRMEISRYRRANRAAGIPGDRLPFRFRQAPPALRPGLVPARLAVPGIDERGPGPGHRFRGGFRLLRASRNRGRRPEQREPEKGVPALQRASPPGPRSSRAGRRRLPDRTTAACVRSGWTLPPTTVPAGRSSMCG